MPVVQNRRRPQRHNVTVEQHGSYGFAANTDYFSLIVALLYETRNELKPKNSV